MLAPLRARAAIACRIVAVDAHGVPAGGLEAGDLIDGIGRANVGPSIEMPLSS